MLIARKRGQYAIIRNNQLFIDGKKIPIRGEEIEEDSIPDQSKHNKTITPSRNQTEHHNQSDLTENNTFRNYNTTV